MNSSIYIVFLDSMLIFQQVSNGIRDHIWSLINPLPPPVWVLSDDGSSNNNWIIIQGEPEERQCKGLLKTVERLIY